MALDYPKNFTGHFGSVVSNQGTFIGVLQNFSSSIIAILSER